MLAPAQEEAVTTTVYITKEIILQSLPHQSSPKSRGKEHGRDASLVQFLVDRTRDTHGAESPWPKEDAGGGGRSFFFSSLLPLFSLVFLKTLPPAPASTTSMPKKPLLPMRSAQSSPITQVLRGYPGARYYGEAQYKHQSGGAALSKEGTGAGDMSLE